MPMSVRQGINVFLAGFIPSENIRFRNEELTFIDKKNNNNNVVLGKSEATKDN